MFSPKSKSRLHRSGLSSGVRTESSFQRVADERWAESLTLPQRSAHWALDEGDPADPIALSIGELSLPVVSDSDLGNLMRAEMHYKHSILQAGPQGHRVSAKGFADAKVSVLERDLALILDFPHDITGTVFNRRQNLRKAPRADLITAGWYCHAQRLVWPLVVVDLAPLIEPGLRLGEILQDGPGQHLGFQGAVEPFLLALSLGMARPPMAYPDSQSQQPNRQRRVGMVRITAPPRRTIVHQHRLGQPIATKGCGQLLLHGLSLLVPTGLQAQGKAGMIIHHPQGMTPLPVAQSKMPFEIHLPQLIGCLSLEALKGSVFARLLGVYSLMAAQNRVHRAAGGNFLVAQYLQPGPNRASAPSRIRIPKRQHLGFHLDRRSLRRLPRSPRPIPQSQLLGFPIPLQPFVAGLATNPKPTAQLLHVRFRLDRQLDKFSAHQHERPLFPRHAVPP